MKLSKVARVGLFAAAAGTMSAVCFFHASHVGAKTPHIHVKNFGDTVEQPPQQINAPGVYIGAPLHVQGMDLTAPLENFEKAFNEQVDKQDEDRSNDYLYAAFADAAGAAAALVSVIIEATAVENDSNDTEDDQPNKPSRDGENERCAENGSERAEEKANSANSDDNTTHEVNP